MNEGGALVKCGELSPTDSGTTRRSPAQGGTRFASHGALCVARKAGVFYRDQDRVWFLVARRAPKSSQRRCRVTWDLPGIDAALRLLPPGDSLAGTKRSPHEAAMSTSDSLFIYGTC